MKNFEKLFVRLMKYSFLVSAIFLTTKCLFAEILWQKEYNCGDSRSCSPGAVVVDNVGNKLLLLGTSFEVVDQSEGKFFLWQIDLNNGSITSSTYIKDVPIELRSNVDMGDLIIKGISISNGSDIFAVGHFDSEESLSFIKMNLQGQIVYSTLVEGDVEEREIIIRMFGLDNDSFVLIGQKSSGLGMITKLDLSGSTLWKKTYTRGDVNIFTGGVGFGSEGGG